MIVLVELIELVGMVGLIYGLWLVIKALVFWHRRAMRASDEEEVKRIFESSKDTESR